MVDVSKIAPHLPPIIWQKKLISEQSNALSLVTSWKSQTIDAVNQVVTYKGDVKAQFGPTQLSCDELTVDYAKKTGSAVGNLRLVDPEGTLEADSLDFTFGGRGITGNAKNVKLKVEGMSLELDDIDIKPGLWTLFGVKATPSKTHPPEFAFTARKLVLVPGKSGRASHLSASAFGVKLGTVPYLTFSLDKRVTGFKIPALAFKRGQGFGIAWQSTFLLSERTSFTSKFATLPKGLPIWTFEIASTSLPPEKQSGKLSPRTDLGDRFANSYTDNVLVTKPDKEAAELRGRRNLWSIGSYWNLETKGRKQDFNNISKPLEIAYELGGPVGDRGGWLSQFRAQTVRESNRASDLSRLELVTILHSGWKPISANLSIMARLDSHSFLFKGGDFTTSRITSGLLWKPEKRLTLLGGVATTFNSGKALFAFDDSYHSQFAYGRADVALGSINLSSLIKYDFDRREIADVEYGFSFAAGAFEPYFNYRQVPRELQFGFRLRMGSFFERLSERNITRKSTNAPK